MATWTQFQFLIVSFSITIRLLFYILVQWLVRSSHLHSTSVVLVEKNTQTHANTHIWRIKQTSTTNWYYQSTTRTTTTKTTIKTKRKKSSRRTIDRRTGRDDSKWAKTSKKERDWLNSHSSRLSSFKIIYYFIFVLFYFLVCLSIYFWLPYLKGGESHPHITATFFFHSPQTTLVSDFWDRENKK